MFADDHTAYLRSLLWDAHQTIHDLCTALQEQRQSEIDTDHGGDPYADCSYCRTIAAARQTNDQITALLNPTEGG